MADVKRAGGAAAREVPPLSLRAAVQPSTVDLKKRTVEVVFTTGARVMRGGFWEEPFWEELSLDPKHVRMERINNGAPLLNDHGGWRGLQSVIGVVDKASLEEGRGVATVRFSARAEVEPIFQDVVAGILQNVSVGYRVHKFEKVEGGEGKVPVMRATDWEPFEVSAVPMGADDGAGFRSARDTATNRCEFVSTRAAEEDQMTTKTVAALAAITAAGTPAETPGTTGLVGQPAGRSDAAELARATDAAVAAEMTRAQQIRTAVRAAKLDESIADKLIADKSSVDSARAHVLDLLASRDDKTTTTQHNRMEVGEDAADKFQQGAAAWLFRKSGSDVVARAVKAGMPGFEKVELDPGEFRGASIADLARLFLESRGRRVQEMDKVRVVRMALEFRSGYQTTSDFAVLLENVLHKTMEASYGTTPDTWRRFCKVGSVPDFRASNRYRNGSFGVLDTLNEHGEFKNKTIPDGDKRSISIGTRGNIIALSRQVIINDDMGAFTGLAERFGRAAALSIEAEVYRMLLLNGGLGPTQSDAQPFFHSANRSNVNTVGSALGVAGLDADRVVMGSQRDSSGNEILELRPKILLVPLGLGGVARVTNDAQYDPDTANKLQMPNRVRGLFTDVVDTARLSGTRRYLFADPQSANAIEVAFLEGQTGPVLESEDGWRTDGTEWKLRLDFGVAFIDPKGAVTNAGA